MERVDLILTQARNSIGLYCINTCKAHCCKNGKLFLFSIEELSAITQNQNQKYLENKNITKNEFGNFYFDLETNGGCPNLDLKTYKCGIYGDKNKPRICDDFPLFKAKDYIISASICPAVQKKCLKTILKNLKSLVIKLFRDAGIQRYRDAEIKEISNIN